MLQAEALSKRYGDRILFEHLDLSIERGAKIGLIAPNGSGKTTLLNILTGLEASDEGQVVYERNVRWAYLEQLPKLPPRDTILEACFNPHDAKGRLVTKWTKALKEGREAELHELIQQMDEADAWNYEQKAKEILTALDIKDTTKSLVGLSGGEVKRIALAGTLISEPDLLYLDEPTNHLDLKSIEWLEAYLSRSSMSLVLITHDRYFLDRVCNEIVELQAGHLYRYKGNYNYYLSKREERINGEQASYARSQNLYRRELEWIRRQPQARGGKARYRVEAFELLEQKLANRRAERQLSLKLGDEAYIGNKIFEAQGVSKKFGDKVILSDFSYVFSRYDKVGIIGENGVGKTTFIKMLLDEEPLDAGYFSVGETVRFGYYSQHDPNFDPKKRVIDVVQDIAEQFEHIGDRGATLSASQLLTQFLFPPEKQYAEVAKLSGGERKRLFLCTILAQRPNFLILDEPTNDLDIPTLHILEEYLMDFRGCVIIISHDRFFTDKVVDHLLCFEGGGVVRDFPGGYSLYRAWQEERLQERAQLEKATQPSLDKQTKGKPSTADPLKTKPARLSYAEKRELEVIEKRILELEEEKRRLEEEIASNSLQHDRLIDVSSRIGVVMEELDNLVLRLLELEEKSV